MARQHTFPCCDKKFGNYDSLQFFENFSLVLENEENHSYSEFRRIQQKNNSEIPTASLKPFSSKKTDHQILHSPFKTLEPLMMPTIYITYNVT